jgi:sugar-specific transcriptional regulator TrmB
MNFLRNLGLSFNDIKVYEAILNLGEAKSGKIIKESNVVSSQTYESLKHLLADGLITYQVRNNVRYYSPQDLTGLIDKTFENLTGLQAANQEIKKVITESRSTKYDTNLHHGKRAFKKAMRELITDEGINEMKVISYGGIDNYPKSLRNLFNEVDQNIIDRGITAKFLIDRHTFEQAKQDRGHHLKHFELRFLDKSYFGPTAYDITANRVLLSVWGKNPIVIEIGNLAVVESYNNNFDYLWSIAAKT